jgi:glutathione S-transferase
VKMKLRYSPASPFARKVRVFAHEAGLTDQIEMSATDVWSPDSDIAADNPFSKVPTLLTADGSFFGSLLCCEYLDTLHKGSRLIPRDSREYWTALQRHALADGLMEAAVAHATERLRRPREYVYQGYLDRQADKIRRALTLLAASGDYPYACADIATITLACALSYLDFRLPELRWRTGADSLALWHATFATRDSMVATQIQP